MTHQHPVKLLSNNEIVAMGFYNLLLILLKLIYEKIRSPLKILAALILGN
jgi:hypothetical protein